MLNDRWWRAAARAFRWILAGFVAALVYELVNIEMGMVAKTAITSVILGVLLVFGTVFEYYIQSSLDPDVEDGWGP